MRPNAPECAPASTLSPPLPPPQDHAQYLGLNDLLHYALFPRVYLSRLRHSDQRPTASVVDAPRAWWRYAKCAAVSEWGAAAAPLSAPMLRRRREYLEAYQRSLLADLGGPPLSRQMAIRLVDLERHAFSVGQASNPSSRPPPSASLLPPPHPLIPDEDA